MTTWALLRTKALIWKNGLLRGTRRQWLSRLAFLAFIAYLAYELFGYLVRLFALLENLSPGASQGFLATTLSSLISFALFWGMGMTLGQLYLSSDLELLLAAPILPFNLYLLKLVEGLQAISLPGVLSLGCLLAYGAALQSSWIYYVVAAAGFLSLLVLVSALSMAIIMLIVRWLPAHRAQEMYTLVWMVSFGAIWAAWMIASNRSGGPSLAQRILSNQAAISQIGRYLSWSPAGWLAGMLASWQARAWGAFGLNLALLLLGTGAVVSVAYAIYQRAFYLGWSRLQEVTPRRQRASIAKPKRYFSLARLMHPLPVQIRALVVREWTTLPRDLRQLGGFFFPIVMGIVYIYLAASGDTAQRLPGSVLWMAMAFVPVIPFFLTIYYTAGTIGLEGSNFALLRVVPLSAERLLWGKFWASFGPTLLLTEATMLIVALFLGATLLQTLLFAVFMIWFTAGSVAIAIGGALLGPNFKATSARRAISPLAGYAILFLNVSFWLVNLALVVLALIKAAPAMFGGTLVRLIAALFPPVTPYLDSPLAALAVVAAEMIICIIIGALWKHGTNWIEKWEITTLD